MDAVPLDEPLDPRRHGDKAATLARLRAAGLPVPDGLVVSVDLLDAWRDEDPPTTLRDTVIEAMARLGPGPVAVRSSAVGEDGAAASHAGLFVTHLDVTEVDEALDAIADIRASVRLGRVTAYRGTSTEPQVAVLLQRQLAASRAGVAFTADPVTGERAVVRVSAVRGLAEALVSGLAVPEDWVVADDGTVTLVAPCPDGEVLDEAAARAIADLARRAEAVLGTPVDVEWAADGTSLAVVQARPITVVPSPPEDTLEGTGWQKDEVHYPEPYTPFGASVMVGEQCRVDDGFATMTAEFGLLVADMQTQVVGGEVYVRPTPVVGPPDATGSAPPAWLLGVVARLAPPLRARMRAARAAVEAGLLEDLPRRWEEQWRDEWLERTGRLAQVEVEGLDDEALIAHADDCFRMASDGALLHFRLFIPYAVALHEWVQAAQQHLGWDTGRALAVLASPASVAGVRDLRDIALAIPAADRDEVRRASAPVDTLRGLGHADLADRLATWIRRNAWRTSNYDPGSPALAERPALIARMMVDLAQAPARAQVDVPRPPDLAGTPDEVRAAYERARRLAPLREDNVLLTDNVPLGLIRRWLVEASGRLADRGLLDRRDDAAFLAYDEVVALLTGSELPDARQRVARRRGEHAWVRAHPGPRALGTPGPPPDVRHLPAAGRRLNGALLWMMSLEYPPAEPASVGDEVASRGIGASAGSYRGPVRVVRGEADFGRLRPGEVLVCPVTTPAWTVLFALAGALVTDGGGVLSHTAIVAREHGLPAVVATGSATRDLRDGDVVEVDGTAGTVRRAADVHRPV